MTFEEVRKQDDPLVDAARNGDRDAFNELVRLHQNEVYTLALRLTADREMANDVAQEAFVRAWRSVPRFRGDARFSTWMHRITVNTALTHRKRTMRRRVEPLDGFTPEPESSSLSPESAGEAAGLRPKLLAALASLPDTSRMVVVLKDIHGWTHGEIAEHLGISITAAKVRLHRGRKALRTILFDVVEAGGA